MTLPVGADIESLCSKCGDVWHVVVAKVGDKVVKVLCKQCGGQHRYKPLPGAVSSVNKTPARATRKGSSRKKRAPEPPPPPVVNLSRPVQPYHMTTCFEVGDRIAHPTFGEGVVEEMPGPGKMQVCFPAGRKLLVHDRELDD